MPTADQGNSQTPMSGKPAPVRSTPPRAYAVYPPHVTDVEILGYVVDVNDIPYSRDIGRSSILGDKVFYQFGDTFCKDRKGDFVGTVCHTCAAVPNLMQPTSSRYTDIQSNGIVAQFIPFTANEVAFEEKHDENHGRVTLWSFGGIAEDTPASGRGWCWFEIGEIFDDYSCKNLGTGLVRVHLDPDSGYVTTYRSEDPIFGPQEPHWGTFNTLVQGGYVYVWGSSNDDVVLGRVPVEQALDRTAYQYWNGVAYTSDPTHAKPVLTGFAQGQIYRSQLFQPGQGMDYVFIGVNRTGDSKVIMSVAPNLEGPWVDFWAILTATGIDYPDPYRYCMFPHPWAFREQDGVLLITWCEQWPGGVVAGKVSFAMGKSPPVTSGPVPAKKQDPSSASMGKSPPVTSGPAPAKKQDPSSASSASSAGPSS
ncbi:MAG: hypothetical protein M1826_002535 [Phylliscum demangeonii]|nr:MAG: hypothetical protein M1826_002535 [Phylliscum demangeonii]